MAFVVGACDADPVDPTAGSVITAGPANLSADDGYADTAPTFDAVLNEVSLRHPGFKGVVGSEDGTETRLLIDPDAGVDAATLLADVRAAFVAGSTTTQGAARLASERVFTLDPTIREGRPDFHVLYQVKTGLRRFMFESDLVNHLDLDETTGRVVVGTATEAEADQVRTAMTDDELAVADFVHAEPATLYSSEGSADMPFRSTRDDLFRPLISGIEIKMSAPNGDPKRCTLGPVVRHGNDFGFLTASHCTFDRAQVDGVDYFQPTFSDYVGSETAEPAYRGAWYIVTKGYYSDVAFVQTQSGIPLRGQVTFADNCTEFSNDCIESGNTTKIAGHLSYLGVNHSVYKTGRSTGTTAGRLDATCTDIAGDGGRLNLCHNVVRYDSTIASSQPLAENGDSGSVVLTASLPLSYSSVVGVLWGGPGGGTFYYSPWENIWQQERAGTAYGIPVTVVEYDTGVVSSPSGNTGGGSGGGPSRFAIQLQSIANTLFFIIKCNSILQYIIMFKNYKYFTIFIALGGCSYGLPYDDDGTLDTLTENFIRAGDEVPSFGGVALIRSKPIVFTLGEEPAAVQAVQAIFGDEGEIRDRPRRGRASEAMKNRISWLLFDLHPGVGATYTDYDERTGYLRVGVQDASGIAKAYEVIDRAGLPTSEVLLEVLPGPFNF